MSLLPSLTNREHKMNHPVHMNAIQLGRPWLDGRVPDGFWKKRVNRVSYMQWLGQQLGFESSEDWYQIRNRDFRDHNGCTLLQRSYRSSALVAMQDFLPEYNWRPWLFSKSPRGYWNEAENRRAYMQWLEGKLQIDDTEDWYELSDDSFIQNHGSGLLINYYHGSILSAICEFRPEFDWKPWLFPRVPNGFWQLPENRNRYYQWLSQLHHIQSFCDWNDLSREDVNATGGAGLLSHYFSGSMTRLRSDVASLMIEEGV